MNQYIAVQLAALRDYFRDKEALFWTLIFPLIFLIVFRWFDTTGAVNAYIIVIDESDSEVSQTVVESLQQVDGIGINYEYESLDEAKLDLEESKRIDFEVVTDEGEVVVEERTLNVILYFPEDYGSTSTNQLSNSTLFFNESDEGAASPSGIVSSIIESITSDVTISMLGGQRQFTVDRQGLTVNEIGYYDILLPGIIGLGIMQSGIIGMAATISTLKEKHVLKRLSATPLPNWQFILAQVFTFLFISAMQITIMIVLGIYLLDANIYGSIPLIYTFGIGGSFVFLNLGFIAAAITNSSNAATGLANAVAVPMMFLSGVFFLRDGLPDTVRVVADNLPLSPVIDSLRDISLLDASVYDLQQEILVLTVWTLVSFIIAIRVFRFREE